MNKIVDMFSKTELKNGTTRDIVLMILLEAVSKRRELDRDEVKAILIRCAYKGADSTVEHYYMMYLAMKLGASL